MELNFKHIEQLMNLLKEKDLGEIEVCDGEQSIRVAAKEQNIVAAPTAVPAAPVSNAQAFADSEVSTAGASCAPIVGTFYSSPAPDKAPFVQVGSTVKKGDVLYIIESMKLMNEVQSEVSGTVKEILVENGAPVEFGQPVMIIN